MRILITNDGSDTAVNVLPHAVRLAEALRAEAVLLRVLNPFVHVSSVVALTRAEAVTRVAKAWDEELQRIAAGTGHDLRTRVESMQQREELVDTVLRVAGEEDAGLIAMDSRGAGALRHTLVGSLTTSVVSRGRMPVVVTGRNVAPPSIDPFRLMITTDGSVASIDIIEALRPLLEGTEVAITLTFACKPEAGSATVGESRPEWAWLEKIKAMLPEGLDVKTVAAPIRGTEKPATTILRVAEEEGVGAIAMSTRGHSAARHVFAGSVAMAVLGHSPVPTIFARR